MMHTTSSVLQDSSNRWLIWCLHAGREVSCLRSSLHAFIGVISSRSVSRQRGGRTNTGESKQSRMYNIRVNRLERLFEMRDTRESWRSMKEVMHHHFCHHHLWGRLFRLFMQQQQARNDTVKCVGNTGKQHQWSVAQRGTWYASTTLYVCTVWSRTLYTVPSKIVVLFFYFIWTLFLSNQFSLQRGRKTIHPNNAWQLQTTSNRWNKSSVMSITHATAPHKSYSCIGRTRVACTLEWSLAKRL